MSRVQRRARRSVARNVYIRAALIVFEFAKRTPMTGQEIPQAGDRLVAPAGTFVALGYESVHRAFGMIDVVNRPDADVGLQSAVLERIGDSETKSIKSKHARVVDAMRNVEALHPRF